MLMLRVKFVDPTAWEKSFLPRQAAEASKKGLKTPALTYYIEEVDG
jgi:hypothetical protein